MIRSSIIFSMALLTPASLAPAEVQIQSPDPVVERAVCDSVWAKPDIAAVGAGVASESPAAVQAMRAMRGATDRGEATPIQPGMVNSGGTVTVKYAMTQ